MALSAAIAAGLLLAALGLVAARSAPLGARWLAFVVAVGFAVTALVADRTELRDLPARRQRAELQGDVAARRTAALRAAAQAGPRVDELELRWRVGEASAAPRAALGAVTSAPASVPFAPEDVRVRAVAQPEVERPALLEFEVEGLTRDVSAEVIVRDADGDVLRESVTLGAAPASVSFTPARAGAHEVSLEVLVGGGDAPRIRAEGRFEVAAPDEVLVVGPPGVVAAALRAQGERVRVEPALPPDWRRHGRVVLGRTLPAAQQMQLVEAVRDGLGLFVLGAALGSPGAPLAAVLPVRVLPQQRDDPAGGGGGGPAAGGEPPADGGPEPPAPRPPAEPPPAPPDRIGDTAGASEISPEPVEVDKHAIAMVLVVDRSGSMGVTLPSGVSKMSYAKTSALRTAQALGAGDQVALVTFGDQGAGRIELPLTDAAQVDVVRSGIEQLAARQEWTFLLSGLRSAHALLRDLDVSVRHVVVLTDGEFQMGQALALGAEANRMRTRSKVTVSIISIVDPRTDPDFKAIARDVARDGGGVFIATDEASSVPVLVSGEVTRALSRVGRTPNVPGGAVPETPDEPAPSPADPPPQPPPPEPEPPPPPPPEPEPPARLPVYAVAESSLLAPVPDAWPSLGGAVACEAPLDSRVLLLVDVGEQGRPLLAFANRGLGRVGAFAADLDGADGALFRAAADLPAWLAQWLRATEVAAPSVEAADVRDRGEVVPAAPVPSDLAFLAALGGGRPRVDAGEGAAADPVDAVGRAVTEQVSALAALLLPLLLLLAALERWLGVRALRRGDG